MDEPEGPAAPLSGNPPHPSPLPQGEREFPSDWVCDDPDILALLDFEPAPRKRVVEGAWTPELQREFIARLAVTGSPGIAAEEMGKTETGVRKLYRSPEAQSFRDAWEGAVELAKRRKAERAGRGETVAPGARPPALDGRVKWSTDQRGPRVRGGDGDPRFRGGDGEVENEFGEWEDEGSYQQRIADARDNICRKLLGARRLYLMEISANPGKRAAFEILTQYPVDWDKAARLEPQDDEPWHRGNQRQPDMILTAENGWSAGEWGYGEDRKAMMRAALDAGRAELGLPPVDWSAER